MAPATASRYRDSMSGELDAMRTEYGADGLTETDAGADPIALFERWLADAIAARLPEPNAMALATATPEGNPSVRIVLLKSLDANGAIFHTNYSSRKGDEMESNPRAAAVLLWHPMARQVRIEGAVERIPEAESDAYFVTRPPGGRISAAASPQSQVVADRAELEQLWAEAQASGAGEQRPENWGGYRIALERIEFWHGRENRLHDRLRFTRVSGQADQWQRERLAP